MKKLAKISAIILTAGIASGCATTGDIDKLNARIDGLNNQISKVSSDIGAIKSAADEANARAVAAEIIAIEARDIAQDTNSKLDNMFKKSMMK